MIRLQRVDIGSVITKVTSEAALMLGFKQQELSVELGENLLLVEADRQRLAQIVFNLVSNAIKFSPSQSNIVIKAWQATTDLMVSIKDSASALPEKETALIFEPYYRSAEPSRRRSGVEKFSLVGSMGFGVLSIPALRRSRRREPRLHSALPLKCQTSC